jgi:hypothetical protein
MDEIGQSVISFFCLFDRHDVDSIGCGPRLRQGELPDHFQRNQWATMTGIGNYGLLWKSTTDTDGAVERV